MNASPESLDQWMFCVVRGYKIAQSVTRKLIQIDLSQCSTSILTMFSPIDHINFSRCTRNQYSQFIGIEHPQPLEIDHITQTFTKLQHLLVDLLVQFVVRDEMDVFDAILIGHRDIPAIRFQFNDLIKSTSWRAILSKPVSLTCVWPISLLTMVKSKPRSSTLPS